MNHVKVINIKVIGKMVINTVKVFIHIMMEVNMMAIGSMIRYIVQILMATNKFLIVCEKTRLRSDSNRMKYIWLNFVRTWSGPKPDHYLESDPKNYLFLRFFNVIWATEKMCVKNRLQFVSKLLFLFSNLLRESNKS